LRRSPKTTPSCSGGANVWSWFDAATALHAFAEVSRDNPQAKLVLTGGRPPRGASKLDDTEAARELAGSLGLLGNSVFFLDDWIPHADRHEYLQEADLGLTLHRDTPEKEVAARGRYMDYLWARHRKPDAAGRLTGRR